MMKRNTISQEMIAEIQELRRQGLSYNTISKRLKEKYDKIPCRASIYRIGSKVGVPTRVVKKRQTKQLAKQEPIHATTVVVSPTTVDACLELLLNAMHGNGVTRVVLDDAGNTEITKRGRV